MATISISREGGPANGRYVGHVAGIDGEAELTFAHRDATTVVANHAYAPHAMRGTGVALAMVERLVADARDEGFRIVPRCPYIRLQMSRRPEWAALIAG